MAWRWLCCRGEREEEVVVVMGGKRNVDSEGGGDAIQIGLQGRNDAQ